MIGSFGTIGESTHRRPPDLTWEIRYSGLDLRDNMVRIGSDLLGADAGIVKLASPLRLPGNPRRTSDGKLWIPVTGDEATPTPPIVDVGHRRVGPLWRIRCERPVHVLPGVIARVGSREVRLLATLDGSNPAATASLLRRFAESDLSSAVDIRQALGERVQRAGSAEGCVGCSAGGLAPAAATILSTIQARAPGATHEVEFVKKGAQGVIETLIGRRLIRRLSSGQVIDEARFQDLRLELASGTRYTTSRDAAELWSTSHGFALAMLEEMVNDGVVTAMPGKQFWVHP